MSGTDPKRSDPPPFPPLTMGGGGADSGPLFLARSSYRRRRLMDAARLLPCLGLVFFMLPMIWLPGSSGASTATGGVFLFVSWFVLIILAALLARRLSHPLEQPEPEDHWADDP